MPAKLENLLVQFAVWATIIFVQPFTLQDALNRSMTLERYLPFLLPLRDGYNVQHLRM